MAIIRKIRDAIVLLCMLVLGLLIIAKLEQQQASSYPGPFWAVDGDTLSFAGERLRLAGIDAPEIEQTCDRRGEVWPCGSVARAHLQRLAGRDTTCGGSSRDKYGRVLVACSGASGDIAALMVREGLALSYGGYGQEEDEARAAGRGLWAGPFDRPEDFRRQRGLAEDAAGASWLSDLADWLLDRI